MSSKLFALDIGTRTVVGIILEESNGHFHVADIVVKEHKERAMVDGQIHDVLHVAELITEIRAELEEKHGPLHKASVAAAGRSLKTEQAAVTIPIRNHPIFTEEDINRLELQAVQKAQQQLVAKKAEGKTAHYYCVGYSVLHYKLDDQEIGSLLDQQGEEANIEVIATFLPRVVVESLIAALKRAGLEMGALTLEPIAAINVLIPPTMRRLNVALVDIGAGTSDIAITDQSTIVAYGMVPTAGDEITEALSDQYLLDFPIAEKIKCDLLTAEEVVMQDILGFDQSFPASEVLTTIAPAIKQLAQAIGEEILRLNNNQAPKAVMLVGGGSLTPNLTVELGHILSLPANRIAVRGIEAIQNLTREEGIAATPELVTPIGIAIAAKKMPIQYMSITVNEQIVRLFEVKDMTVGDALLAANIRANQLFGKPGHGLSITVNGQDIIIPGKHGLPAQILLNGETASTKSIIKSNDSITIIEGKHGEIGRARVKDIADDAATKIIYLGDSIFKLEPQVFINDKKATLQSELKDRDIVRFMTAETIEDVFTLTGKEDLLKDCTAFNVYIDNRALLLPSFSSELLLNGKPAKLSYPVKNNDAITIGDGEMPTITLVAEHADVKLQDRIVVTFQGDQVVLEKTAFEAEMNRQIVTPQTRVPNGAKIKFNAVDAGDWIFQDIFRFTDWQLPVAPQGTFKVLRNGIESGFDTAIFGGDKLEIVFHNHEEAAPTNFGF